MRLKKNKEVSQTLEGKKVLVYDYETTGLDSGEDRIIQAVLYLYEVQNNVWNKLDGLETYINPERELPEIITQITGITQGVVNVAPKEEEVWPKIYKLFSAADIICGHNILAFDNRFSRALFNRHGKVFDFGEENSFDTLVGSRDLVPKNKAINYSHKLCDMMAYYNLKVDGKFHDASTDVMSCVVLAQKLVEEYKKWDNTDTQFSNPRLKVSVKRVTPWVGKFPNAYQKANFLFIDTDSGRWRFNRYSLEWQEIERTRPVSLEAVVQATYTFCGVDNDGDLAHWKKPE